MNKFGVKKPHKAVRTITITITIQLNKAADSQEKCIDFIKRREESTMMAQDMLHRWYVMYIHWIHTVGVASMTQTSRI